MKYFGLPICILLAAAGCQTAQPPEATRLMSVEYVPSVEALQEIVAVCERYLKRAQALANIHQLSLRDVTRLRIQLAESRRELAAQLGQPYDELAQLRAIVEFWAGEAKEQRLRSEVGQANLHDGIEAEVKHIRARDRLRQAEQAASRG